MIRALLSTPAISAFTRGSSFGSRMRDIASSSPTSTGNFLPSKFDSGMTSQVAYSRTKICGFDFAALMRCSVNAPTVPFDETSSSVPGVRPTRMNLDFIRRMIDLYRAFAFSAKSCLACAAFTADECVLSMKFVSSITPPKTFRPISCSEPGEPHTTRTFFGKIISPSDSLTCGGQTLWKNSERAIFSIIPWNMPRRACFRFTDTMANTRSEPGINP